MAEPIVSMRGVNKRYIKYDDTPTLLNALRPGGRTRRSELWAVRDLDLELRPGESVGVLGRNGAGKSTMLQMLAGITAPSSGRVEVRGRVAPLISVGVGFHPELTGRENIYVNGTVLGLDKATIDRRYDAIVAFAELENFIDTPVKFYSSGMFLRLGFAVAVEARPDILLVDEILAVGDFPFQLKCHERMQQIREQGTTVVTVSHNLSALRGFCNRGLVMQAGRLTFDGSIFDAIGHYHETLADLPVTDPSVARPAQAVADIVEFELLDGAGQPVSHVPAGDKLLLRLTVRANQQVERPFAGVVLTNDARGVCVYSDSNHAAPYSPLAPGETATYEISFPADLPTGGYTVFGTLLHWADRYRFAEITQTPAESFYVTGRTLVGGMADLQANFLETSADRRFA